MDDVCFATNDCFGDHRKDEEITPLHHLAKKNDKIYSLKTLRQIQILYIIATIGWILLIYICKLYQIDAVGWIFLIAPLIVFGINFASTQYHTVELEGEMFHGNFLSFGFLITIILINWTKVKNKQRLFKILMIALILIMFSLVDFWVGKQHLILSKHLRSILQTAALFLLAYALYYYYISASDIVSGTDAETISFEEITF